MPQYKIADYIESQNGECEVFPAPFAVFLNENDTNYVEPDISIICDKNKISDKGCHGAPDWVIEIVSSGNRAMDYFTKLFKYQTAGVREYITEIYTHVAVSKQRDILASKHPRKDFNVL